MLRQLSYAIRDRWLPYTKWSYYRRSYAIKNQQFLRSNLDIEVDKSALEHKSGVSKIMILHLNLGPGVLHSAP